jgi:protoheme IX farnesyltransferase
VRPFFWLAVAAVVSTYLLIVIGAVVRVTGSGDGCGPDWPTCRGQLLPPLEVDALIEFTHRLVAAATSTLILAIPVAAWLWRRERRILVPATLIPILLACQIVLGAVVVWMGLHPMAVLVHLGFAMLILGGMVWIAVQAAPRPRVVEWGPARSHYVPLLGVTAAAVFGLILTGAYTRATGASGACVGFPGCTVPAAAVQALERAAPAGALGLVQIHLLHRVTAYVVSVIVAAAVAETWRLRRGVPALRKVAGLLLTCLVVQVAIGAATASTGLPTFLRGSHVAGAAAVWASSILLFALARRLPTETSALPLAPASPARRPERSAASAQAGSVTVSQKLRAYYRLTKPKVILLLEVPTLAAMLVAGHDLPSPVLVIATLLGGAFAAGGAAAINSYIDRDIDAVMGSRTQTRPIPAGIVSAGEALAFGLALAVASFAVLALFANLLAAFLAQAALLVYVFVYTVWLKRSTPSNIVIGGAAGAIPPLVGWAAVTGDVGPAAWLLFAIIFFWTPPHFWALALIIRQHYARANVPMLPVVRGDAETRRQIVYYTLQMIAVTVLLFAFGLSGLFYFWSALVLGGVFLYLAARLWREATTRAAAHLFHYSMLYLWLLSAALVLDKRLFS